MVIINKDALDKFFKRAVVASPEPQPQSQVDQIVDSFPEEIRDAEGLDVIKTEASDWESKADFIVKAEKTAVDKAVKAEKANELALQLILLKRQSQIKVKAANENIGIALTSEKAANEVLHMLTQLVKEDLTDISLEEFGIEDTRI